MKNMKVRRKKERIIQKNLEIGQFLTYAKYTKVVATVA